jgi:ABC-2 type transport system permease protein
MTVAVTGLDLVQRRRGLLAWSAGFAVYVLLIVGMYPSFKDSTGLDEFATNSPEMAALFGITGSLTEPAGWLNANIYANFLPLVLLLLAIGYGAMAIAGQEERGTLALVQVLPISRRRVVLEKAGALAVQVAVVGAVSFVCSLAGRAFDLDVPVADLAWTTVTATLLGIAFGLLALAVGAATGERVHAIAVAGGIAAASYLVASLAPVSDFFHAIRWTSLFFWSVSDDQIGTGVSVADVVVLAATAVLLTVVAVVAYERHDLRG